MTVSDFDFFDAFFSFWAVFRWVFSATRAFFSADLDFLSFFAMLSGDVVRDVAGTRLGDGEEEGGAGAGSFKVSEAKNCGVRR